MTNQLLAAMLLSSITLAAGADDGKAPQKDAAPKKAPPPVTLKPGDRAPALTVSKWLQGDPVKAFEPGKVYVVEFWATWCGPCIYFMPHLAELQAAYRDKGVTFIGFTARDPDNTLEKAAAFVTRRGPKLGYTFAYGDDRTTFDAWMTAAGRQGIPCTFVVDRTGRIAYVGSPMYLPFVLPKVVAGDRPEDVAASAARVERELSEISSSLFPDNRAGLQKLAAFEARYPALTNCLYSIRVKLSLLPKIGDVVEAKKVAEAVMARAVRQDNPSVLLQVAALLRNGPGKESKELLAVAVQAAEAAVKAAGEQDANALLDLAETYAAVGARAKARAAARQAVAAAAGEPAERRRKIEEEARKVEEATKEGGASTAERPMPPCPDTGLT